VDIIARLAELSLRLGPELAAFEVNPLRVTPGRVEALDAAVIWRSAGQAVHPAGRARSAPSRACGQPPVTT
jgi:succinyl-CoA synthetase beta subunit